MLAAIVTRPSAGRAPLAQRGSDHRSVAARFRKELHPSYYETVQSAIRSVQAGFEDPESLTASLAEDFIAPSSDRRTVRALNKAQFISMQRARAAEPAVAAPRVLATAVCPSDSAMALEPDDQVSGFALLATSELGAAEGAKEVQFASRVIVNKDGQCRVLESFRPLMGPEPELLLKDPAGYRQRLADLPRLDVREAQGDMARMQEITNIIARDIFNTGIAGSYAGESLDFMTDDVVLYDGHGDYRTCPVTGNSPVCRGKAAIDAFAKALHQQLVGTQQMLAMAASEDSNTAFAHFAMLVMGKTAAGWCNAAHRTLLAVTFDESCTKVNAIAAFRTFMAYERDLYYKPGAAVGAGAAADEQAAS